jgi:hypothetical protein
MKLFLNDTCHEIVLQILFAGYQGADFKNREYSTGGGTKTAEQKAFHFLIPCPIKKQGFETSFNKLIYKEKKNMHIIDFCKKQNFSESKWKRFSLNKTKTGNEKEGKRRGIW